jgi:hypothetical protein
MCQSINNLADGIYDGINGISDPREKCDFLYLNQRIDHILMPWREYFTGQVGYVHNPYLDGGILNFVKKMPGQLRKEKFLFRDTITNMFPELFSIGPATSSGYHSARA